MKGDYMKSYKVEITETLRRNVAVEAENSTEAVENVADAWDEGLFELDGPDTSDTYFSLIGDAEDSARAVL